MTSVHVRRLQNRVARTAARLTAYAQQHNVPVADLASVRLPWFSIRNQAGDGEGQADEATVFIFDEIGGSLGVSAKQFAADLQEITAPVIKVRINSPGGSVFDSIAIHSALLHHPAKIVVYVDGIAASGASVIAMAGDEVVMMPGSQMMIHDAWGIEEGPEADMLKMGSFLGRQSGNVATMYQRRGGGEASDWRALMLAETWMFDTEAVAAGLADRVDESAQRGDAGMDEMMSRGYDLAAFTYRYAGRDQAPAPQQHRTATCRAPVPPVRTQPRKPEPQLPTGRTGTPAPAIGEEFREQAGRAAMTRRDQVRARADRPAQRRCAPDREARGVLVAKTDMRLTPLASLLDDPGAGWEFRGVASAYERQYPMWDTFGEYVEVVTAGAGEKSLRRSDLDVPLVLDHSSLRRIARTTNGSLILSESDSGLEVFAPELDASDVDVAYIVPKILAKLVDEMSFKFMIEAGQWSSDFTEYRIAAYELHRGDVTIIGYGANPATTVALRKPEAVPASQLALRLQFAIAE